MIIVGITGAEGFLGYHLRAFLHGRRDVEVRMATRHTFETSERLDTFVAGLDVLAHFAGVNRGEEAAVEAANIELAKALVASLRRTGATPALAFANSTHMERNSGYGRGKRAAAALLAEWAGASGVPFSDMILPNVFGEFGRPFYNSVVATFCHQLAAGERPTVLTDAAIELVHAQEVARRCWQALTDSATGTIRVNGVPCTVSALLGKLEAFYEQYSAQVMPNLSEPIDAQLFNVLRSYMFPRHYPMALSLRSDERGALYEAVRTLGRGQIFLSITHSGVTRGNHYHRRKVERFLVVRGNAEIRVRRLFDDRLHTFRVSGEEPCAIDMPTFCSHSITNVGAGELLTLFWANEIYDPADPDTYPEAVLQ